MTPDVGAQLRKGVVEQCVLGLLDREPMYGWQLAERLTGAGLIASIGTLYPVLGRLRDRGLVVAFERATGTGPVRKYYRPTAEGVAELARFRGMVALHASRRRHAGWRGRMTATGPDPAADYLARLDDALRDVPFGMAREIHAGIEEELASLPLATRRQRIDELGDPVRIATEAAEGSSDAGAHAGEHGSAGASVHAMASAEQASGFGRGPWHVVSTAIAIGIGGLVVPVLGWVVGLVLLWAGRVWTRPERWFATLAPVVATLVAVGIWWLVQGGPVEGSMSATETGFRGRWLLLLGWVAGNVAVAAWLLVSGLRRTRG